MTRLDFTVLDHVVAQSGHSRISGTVVKMELEEDFSFNYGPPTGIVNVSIRLSPGTVVEAKASEWNIVKLEDPDGR